MQIIPIIGGKTDVFLSVFIEDTRTNDGSGLAGLLYNTSGLVCRRQPFDGLNSAISLVNTSLGSHTDGGFTAMDGTNAPGWYQLQIPDAAIQAGFGQSIIQLRGAANMAVTNILLIESSVNIGAISGDETAADNLELDYDGTGYAKSNSAIGTTTTIGSTGLNAITDQVLDELLSGHTVAGSVGKALADIETDADTIKRNHYCRFVPSIHSQTGRQ